jgi:hypothetical protein
VPYAGGGIGFVNVTERADFAERGENVDETHTSYHVLGGLELPLARWYGAGLEAGWRWVPDGLRGSGVAEEFDEPHLGHFFLMARFTIGR